tara:strand:- start:218 stop:685 length:468 start_codon:yes stop_codon:yes gene_type:complete
LIDAVTNFIAAAKGNQQNRPGILKYTSGIILKSDQDHLIINTIYKLLLSEPEINIKQYEAVLALAKESETALQPKKHKHTKEDLTTNREIKAALEKAIATKGAAAEKVGSGGSSGDHSHLELDQKSKLQEKAPSTGPKASPTGGGPTSKATRSAR